MAMGNNLRRKVQSRTKENVLYLWDRGHHFTVVNHQDKVIGQGSWELMKETHKRAKLPPPFPAAPSRPAKYSLAFMRNNKCFAEHGFFGAYAAIHFLDAILTDLKIKWITPSEMLLPNGITIECPELEELMEKDLTSDEKAWELPEPYVGQAESIRKGIPVKGNRPSRLPADGGHTDKVSAPRSKRSSPVVKRETPSGFVGLSDICGTLKIEPRIARQFLRKKEDKPAEGWYWPKKEVVRITELLRKAK